ncbi:MAG: type II secretion system F family protein [Candidatus Aenigmarchaeota archaeon]|nr:type II secretion system F family protein [Candidatus Aenigmarchaeota archaeon]
MKKIRIAFIEKYWKKFFKKEKKLNLDKKTDIKELTLITSFIGLFMVYLNIQLFAAQPQIFSTINLIAVIVTLGVPIFVKYNEYKNVKKIEEVFPKWLSDITGNIQSGMTLPQAIRATTNNYYSALTPHVHEINAKISWGIPFDIVLKDFAERIGSDTLKRTVQTIIEAHRSGGTIDTVLEAVVESVRELERIKKERAASVYSQMINGYLIYVVFLGVMIGLSTFLIPSFQLQEGGGAELSKVYSELFRNLIVIQGFFAGIAIGKMSEGTVIAGMKHALVLVIFGYSAFVLVG